MKSKRLVQINELALLPFRNNTHSKNKCFIAIYYLVTVILLVSVRANTLI